MEVNESAIRIAKESIKASDSRFASVPVDVLNYLVQTIEYIKFAIDHYSSLGVCCEDIIEDENDA